MRTFEEILEEVQEARLNEKKKKVNYDIDVSMGIVGVGTDANGNYSYWLEVAGKNRSVKVQHGSMETRGDKITADDIKKDNVDKTTLKDLKAYVKKYVMKKESVNEKRINEINERKFSLEVGDKYKAKKDVKLKGGVTLKGGVVYTIGSVDPDYIILRKINDKGKMLSNFPISWRDFNKNLDHHVVQENRINEKTQKYDSEYVSQSAKVLAKDMGRSEPDMAWAFSTIHARVNQSYPGNQDISKKDVLDLIDPKMRRKYTDEINDALEMIFQ